MLEFPGATPLRRLCALLVAEPRILRRAGGSCLLALCVVSTLSGLEVPPRTPANGQEGQAVASRNGVSRAELGRLIALWEVQRELVQTAQIDARYLFCGKQDVSRTHMKSFLAQLVPLAKFDPSVETIEAFVQQEFPGPKQYWRDARLTIDGNKFRERLDELEPRNGVINFQETASDGKHTAEYWSDSGQTSIYEGSSEWVHLTLRDFWLVPRLQVEGTSPNDASIASVTSLGNGAMRIDPTDHVSMVINVDGGELLELHTPQTDRYQCAFQKIDGVPFPFVTLRVDYRDEMLYDFSLLIVREASFNRSIEDDFKLTAPAKLRP